MTARNKQDAGTVVLTREEAAFIRRALADCHDVIDHAGASGPGVRRPLDHVQGDASLAIDHIDFPRLNRRTT